MICMKDDATQALHINQGTHAPRKAEMTGGRVGRALNVILGQTFHSMLTLSTQQ